jgi:hypothetical protein
MEEDHIMKLEENRVKIVIERRSFTSFKSTVIKEEPENFDNKCVKGGSPSFISEKESIEIEEISKFSNDCNNNIINPRGRKRILILLVLKKKKVVQA